MTGSDNFDWLIRARASNQQILLRLYRFGKEHEDQLKDDATDRSVFALLVGASFSLWRAAFLTDASRQWPTIMEDATKLLERLVRDNAVAYPQDRETRQWMAGYYLNNAQWRLLEAWRYLRSRHSSQAVPAAVTRLQQIEDVATEREKPSVLWEASESALLEMLEIMTRKLEGGRGATDV